MILPALAASSTCCCVDLLTQKSSQNQADSAQKHCHDEAQKSSQHNHTKCQCNHQVTSSLPSIVANITSSQLIVSITHTRLNSPLFSYHFDNIYRPPISA